MQHLKTGKCIVCGKDAIAWHGHVLTKDRMALGNLVDRKIGAGFCEKHVGLEGDEYGCYGAYDSELMGKCIPLF